VARFACGMWRVRYARCCVVGAERLWFGSCSTGVEFLFFRSSGLRASGRGAGPPPGGSALYSIRSRYSIKSLGACLGLGDWLGRSPQANFRVCRGAARGSSSSSLGAELAALYERPRRSDGHPSPSSLRSQLWSWTARTQPLRRSRTT